MDGVINSFLTVTLIRKPEFFSGCLISAQYLKTSWIDFDEIFLGDSLLAHRIHTQLSVEI